MVITTHVSQGLMTCSRTNVTSEKRMASMFADVANLTPAPFFSSLPFSSTEIRASTIRHNSKYAVQNSTNKTGVTELFQSFYDGRFGTLKGLHQLAQFIDGPTSGEVYRRKTGGNFQSQQQIDKWVAEENLTEFYSHLIIT